MRKNWITLIWLADLCRKRQKVILDINPRNLAKLEQTRLICVHVLENLKGMWSWS